LKLRISERKNNLNQDSFAIIKLEFNTPEEAAKLFAQLAYSLMMNLFSKRDFNGRDFNKIYVMLQKLDDLVSQGPLDTCLDPFEKMMRNFHTNPQIGQREREN
jgi:hypothetical protein